MQQKVDISGTPADQYPLQDLLYRTLALSDASGDIIETYDYDAYGNTLIFTAAGTGSDWWADDATQGDSPSCEFLFTGRRYDAESEIYFYRARYYLPELGRFISRDPIGYRTGDPNLYQYISSRVLIRVDPSGLQEILASSGTTDPVYIKRLYDRGNDDPNEENYTTSRIAVTLKIDRGINNWFGGCSVGTRLSGKSYCAGNVDVSIAFKATAMRASLQFRTEGSQCKLVHKPTNGAEQTSVGLSTGFDGEDPSKGDALHGEMVLGKIPCCGGTLSGKIEIQCVGYDQSELELLEILGGIQGELVNYTSMEISYVADIVKCGRVTAASNISARHINLPNRRPDLLTLIDKQ